jgi:hypothetical protein
MKGFILGVLRKLFAILGQAQYVVKLNTGNLPNAKAAQSYQIHFS